MKYLILLSFILTGCESDIRGEEKSGDRAYEIICIGGVEYYQGRFGYQGHMALRVTLEGKPYQC